MTTVKVLTALLFLLIGAPFILLGGITAVIWMWLCIGWCKARDDFESLLIDVSAASKDRKK